MTAAALLPIALKGALVLAAAFLALRLLRDVPAALRHGVWTAAFAALLVLPALDAFGPSWGLPILPDQARVSEATTYVFGTPAVPPTPPAAVQTRRTTRTVIHSGGITVTARPELPAAFVPTPPRVPEPSVPFSGILLAAWGLGVGALLLRWAAAYVSAAAVVRAAAPVTDDEWLDLAERARRLVGVRGDVRLVRSDALAVPVAWGFGAPAVVLPAGADAWGEGRREAVLLHEMAHLRRADARTQLVAQLAVALHWPNPLAWLAYRRFLTEREHACDDAVLSGGAAPSDYAGHLVEIARRARPHEPLALSAVSAMARRSDLEGRVLSVLDAGRRRVAAGRSPLVRTVALGLLVAAPLGTVRAVAGAPEHAITIQSAPAEAPIATPTVPQAPAVPEPPPVPRLPTADEADLADALLDTIPRAEALLGPALDAALTDVRRLRADGHGLDDDAWDEIEAGVREAFQDAHVDYQDAVAEALAEAEAERADGDDDWRSELRAALAEAEADRQDAVEAMAAAAAARTRGWGPDDEARRAAERQARAAQSAYRSAETAQRERERALRDAERSREQALRDAERVRRHAERAAEDARRRSRDEARHTQRWPQRLETGYAYRIDSGGQTVAVPTGPGVGAWMAQLDALDHAAVGIATAAAEIEAKGTAAPGVLAGLRGGLAGLEGGLEGIAQGARSWARSDAEREIARARLDATQRRIDAAKARLAACDEI